jgi:LysR family transcriptional regulator, carnitine catabolism transcriptional activator
VAKLRDMPLVTTPRGLSTRDLLDRALATAGVEPLIAVETSQREAIAPLVLAGAGTSFLPAALAKSLGAQGAVVARLVPTLTRTIGLVHRPAPLSPAARAFVELARPRRRR